MDNIYELQKKMYSEGLKVEDYFIELAKRDGYHCLKSTRYQDKWEHWDVKMIKDGKSGLVDVKSNKDSHKHGFSWIEFQNLIGRKGWICGLADAIAFEMDDRFDLINRVELKKFIENKIINPTGYVYLKPDNLSEILYHRYRRMGRRDIIVLVPFSDMENFKMKTIYK